MPTQCLYDAERYITTCTSKRKIFTVHAGTGRLPISILSCYGAFKANQWKNWIPLYSSVLLKGLLPQDHFRCWLLLVRACSLLSNCIFFKYVSSADLFLLQFCRHCEHLYGTTSCTFNIHLHLKLHSLHYNGILVSYHTNTREIEPQIINNFTQNQAIHCLDIPEFNQPPPVDCRQQLNRHILSVYCTMRKSQLTLAFKNIF